ncbi:MAG: enoyl-CoA hydratase-related protein [Janthinobacterium lividum]
MTEAPLLATVEAGVARVTLNRPEVRNAFDEVLIAALTTTFARFHADPPRAVVLAGNGPGFCAGADVAWMKRAGGWTEAENRSDAMRLSTMLDTIDRCPCPVIAVARGNVLGGGVGLVAAADMVVASSDARFCLSEVRLGLTPATISPFVLRAIGARAARRWFLTAEMFGADDALAMGLVHVVSDAPEMQVAAWLKALRGVAPGAVAAAKTLIADIAGHPVDEALRGVTADRIAARRASAEGKEGLAAFLDKRAPDWTSQ